jgi:hypothetical protein
MRLSAARPLNTNTSFLEMQLTLSQSFQGTRGKIICATFLQQVTHRSRTHPRGSIGGNVFAAELSECLQWSTRHTSPPLRLRFVSASSPLRLHFASALATCGDGGERLCSGWMLPCGITLAIPRAWSGSARSRRNKPSAAYAEYGGEESQSGRAGTIRTTRTPM